MNTDHLIGLLITVSMLIILWIIADINDRNNPKF